MSGRGRVVSVDRVSIPTDLRDAYRIITDAPAKDRAFYVEVQDPLPAYGDPIRWTTGSVYWADRKVRKLGYAFDPDAPLH